MIIPLWQSRLVSFGESFLTYMFFYCLLQGFICADEANGTDAGFRDREIFILCYVYCPFFLRPFQDLLSSTSWKLFYCCNVNPKWASPLPRRLIYHVWNLCVCPQPPQSRLAVLLMVQCNTISFGICISYCSNI